MKERRYEDVIKKFPKKYLWRFGKYVNILGLMFSSVIDHNAFLVMRDHGGEDSTDEYPDIHAHYCSIDEEYKKIFYIQMIQEINDILEKESFKNHAGITKICPTLNKLWKKLEAEDPSRSMCLMRFIEEQGYVIHNSYSCNLNFYDVHVIRSHIYHQFYNL